MIDAVKINIWRNRRGGSPIICAVLGYSLLLVRTALLAAAVRALAGFIFEFLATTSLFLSTIPSIIGCKLVSYNI